MRKTLGSLVFLFAVSGLLADETGSFSVSSASPIYAADGNADSANYATNWNQNGNAIVTAPTGIALGSDPVSISFSDVAGTITLNSGGNWNDADGNGAAVGSSSNTGYGAISGITLPGAGDIVGVFIDTNAFDPSEKAPAALDFSGAGGSSFSSLSPALDQTFFIGDGLTGDGTGSTQVFNAPTGATMLYLGISDAAGYNGNPGFYGDNSGSFTGSYAVTGGVSGVPDRASTLLLMAIGVGLLGCARFRSYRKG